MKDILFKVIMLKGGDPTEEQIQSSVDIWLNNHPEATTTVQDGSLSEAKLANSLKLKAIKDYVTPEMFGAAGDGVTNDAASFNSCVAFANENGVPIKAFGKYNLSNLKIVIDIDKTSIEGDGTTELISSGLSNGDSFITLISTQPVTVKSYDYPRKALSKLSIIGNYFVNQPNLGGSQFISGINYGGTSSPNTSIVPCHANIEDIVVKYFRVGIYLGSAYKSSLTNISCIACSIGIFGSAGTNTPVHIYNLYIECCANGIYSNFGDYASLYIIGGSMEYCRSYVNAVSRVIFDDYTFEGDLRACCDNSLTPFSPFILRNGYSSEYIFNNCLFIIIPNYSTNVQDWIPNPIMSENVPESMFNLNTSSSRLACTLTLNSVTFAIDPSLTVDYLIATNKKICSSNINIVSGIKELYNTGFGATSLSSGTEYEFACSNKTYLGYKIKTTGTASTLYIQELVGFTKRLVATIPASATETVGVIPLLEGAQSIIISTNINNDYTGSAFCLL